MSDFQLLFLLSISCTYGLLSKEDIQSELSKCEAANQNAVQCFENKQQEGCFAGWYLRDTQMPPIDIIALLVKCGELPDSERPTEWASTLLELASTTIANGQKIGLPHIYALYYLVHALHNFEFLREKVQLLCGTKTLTVSTAKLLTALIKDYPEQAQLHTDRCQCLYSGGQLKPALALCKDSLEKYQLTEAIRQGIYTTIVPAVGESGDFEKAERLGWACVKEFPHAAGCWLQISHFVRRQQHIDAVKAATTAATGWYWINHRWKLSDPELSHCGGYDTTPWITLQPLWAFSEVFTNIEQIATFTDAPFFGPGGLPNVLPEFKAQMQAEGETVHPTLTYDSREAAVLRIRNGRVRGPFYYVFFPPDTKVREGVQSAAHWKRTDDAPLCLLGLTHFPMYQTGQNTIDNSQKKPPIRSLKGGLILHVLTDNFYHTLTEGITKILILMDLGLWNKDIRILMGHKTPKACLQALQILGIEDQAEVFDHHGNQYEYHIETLYVLPFRLTSYTNVLKSTEPQHLFQTLSQWKMHHRQRMIPSETALRYFTWNSDLHPKNCLERMRDVFLSKVLRSEITPPPYNSILLISRKPGQRRALAKQDQLISTLQTYPFGRSVLLPGTQTMKQPEVFVHYGNTSLQDQMYLFHNASVVVGPHGAGFSHIMWMRPGTSVVELPWKWNVKNTSYQMMSAALGIKYYTVPSVTQADFTGDYDLTDQLIQDIARTVDWAYSTGPLHYFAKSSEH